MSQVFLSYSRADRERVALIVEALEAADIPVWWDHYLDGGARFAKEIAQALADARVVVAVWSRSSVESPWVLDEAGVGRDRHVLLPISLDGTRPPLGFGQFHTIDFSGWSGASDAPEIGQLIASIRQGPRDYASESATSAEGNSNNAGRKLARYPKLAGALTMVAVAIGGSWWFVADRGGENSNDAIQSIAVLPFDDLSGGGSQAYFSDGLSEELRTVLSQNPQIQVAAQTSSEYFRGKEADARSIADQLDVSYLVEGSVRKVAGKVRITTQLIDGKTGFERWSQSYDRELDDIFEIQTEIAGRISQALSARLVHTSERPLRDGGTLNVAAYDAYLRGVELYDRAESQETDREALAAFDEAIRIDPEYAAAHAARARALTVIANASRNGANVATLSRQALSAGKQAVALAPELADAHAALGFALLNGQLDPGAAAASYRRSYELGRNDADILAGYATFAFRVGQLAAAEEAIARALRLDPLNPYAFRTAGNIDYAADRYNEAIEHFRRALAINPQMSGVNAAIGNAFYMQGDIPTAREHFALEPSSLTRLKGLAICDARLGKKQASEQALARLVSEYGANGLYQQAQVLAQWGELDAAMDALQRARAAQDSGLVQALNDPMLDPLRNRADFRRLLSALGFD